jgi:hypothetical protein
VVKRWLRYERACIEEEGPALSYSGARGSQPASLLASIEEEEDPGQQPS